MPVHKREVPCNECPFIRTCAPGWLGSYTAQEYLDLTMDEADMPCHKEVDYTDRHWRETQYPRVSRCAGSMIFFRNQLKMPRDPNLIETWRIVRTRDDVFETPAEFMAHHDIPLNKRYSASSLNTSIT